MTVMDVNLGRLLSLVGLLQLGLIFPLSAQQSQSPTGTGTVAASSGSSSTASTATTTTAPAPSFGFQIMRRGGRLASQRATTVIVCDQPNAPFPDFIDVCE